MHLNIDCIVHWRIKKKITLVTNNYSSLLPLIHHIVNLELFKNKIIINTFIQLIINNF